MKKLLFYFGFLALILFSSVDASAQKAQRIVLKNARGEAGRAVAGKVTGTVSGANFREYTFSIPTGRSADISVSTDSGETVVFEVISPKGKSLYKDAADILDELTYRGTYKIRVYRNKESAGKTGNSRFTLTIFMYI